LALRVCETCKHKSTPPPELTPLVDEMSKHYPRVYYCSLLQVIRVYDPSSPAKTFDCDQYEPLEA
jgi:hypothetical protein